MSDFRHYLRVYCSCEPIELLQKLSQRNGLEWAGKCNGLTNSEIMLIYILDAKNLIGNTLHY